jgi:hypothetical protein
MARRLVYRPTMPKPINVIAIAGVIACSSPNSSTPVDANGSNRPLDAAVDATRPIDAPGSGSGSSTTFAFACAGNTTPPTVPATVAVTGSAGSLDTNLTDLAAMMFITPYTGAVSLCSDEPCTSANLLGTATATSTGAFSFGSVTTHAAPVPGYVEIAAAGTGSNATLETLAYVGTPYVKDTAVPPVVLVPQAAIDLVTQNAAAACTTGPTVGYVAYKAVDCAGNVVTDSMNVHATLTQNSVPVGDPPIDVYQTVIAALGSNLMQFDAQAAPLQGIFIVCGVPAGNTTLSVSYASGSGTVQFLPVAIKSVAGAATEVAAQPGY